MAVTDSEMLEKTGRAGCEVISEWIAENNPSVVPPKNLDLLCEALTGKTVAQMRSSIDSVGSAFDFLKGPQN